MEQLDARFSLVPVQQLEGRQLAAVKQLLTSPAFAAAAFSVITAHAALVPVLRSSAPPSPQVGVPACLQLPGGCQARVMLAVTEASMCTSPAKQHLRPAACAAVAANPEAARC
jgi:hypothetical protein